MVKREKYGAIIASWLFFVLFSLGAFAQNSLKFKTLSKSDGLSQASVFSVVQDEEGFMWFGTRDGLNRWDGNEFRVFKHNENSSSLVANDVRALYADSLLNGLWIGTIEGLSFFDFKSENFTNFHHESLNPNSLSGAVIRFIYRDDYKRLWVGTSRGLNLYNHESASFIRYWDDSNSPYKSPLDVTYMITTPAGELWMGSAHGLYKVEQDSSFTKISSNQSIEEIHVKSIQFDHAGLCWIGTSESGLLRWDITSNKIKEYTQDSKDPHSLSNNNIRTICQDKKGQIWVGTFDGLNKYDEGLDGFMVYDTPTNQPYGLSDVSIKSIFCDAKGNLWIGTYYGGVNLLDESFNQFENFTPAPYPKGLNAGVISSFAEDQKHNLWVGTEGGGLNYLNCLNNEFESVGLDRKNPNHISGNNIKSLLLDDQTLWVGLFTQGLNKLNLQNRSITKMFHDPQNPNSLSNNNVYSLFRTDDLLWIATYGGGLDILHLPTNTFRNYQSIANDPRSISSDLTRVIYQMQDQSIWIGTEQGLNSVTLDENNYPKSFTTILPNEKIYALQENKDRNLWIGTISGGLYMFNPQTNETKHFTTTEGLPGNTIFGILEDESGLLWISTNNGLSRMNPHDYSFTNYNESNGLSNNEYNFNAYYKMTNGDLLFGGLNGFTRFNPSDIKPNDFIPNIAFTTLKHNNTHVHISEKGLLNKSLNATEKLVFDYNKANFSIGFAALDFSSPDHNRFAYKLEGLDRDWNYVVGQNEANYTIQRDGKYVFKLRGGNSDGTWNPQERTLEIIVNPPAWRSWWAYLIYFIGLSLGILALYRYVRLKNELKLQEIEQAQQAALHEMKLRFFTNITHEFRTPLTLIMGPLSELMKSQTESTENYRKLTLIEKNTQRLLNLVNQILTFRKLATDHDPVVPRYADMTHFIEEIYLPFTESAKFKEINFLFERSSQEIMVWFDEEKMEKVFFNLFSNALKFTPKGGEIKLQIAQEEKEVVIKVQDNGVGIDPAIHDQIFKRFYEKAYPQNSSIKGSGIGLAISKQMVELHHGKIEVHSEFGKGACFEVRLPLGKAHFDPALFVGNIEKHVEHSAHDFDLKPNQIQADISEHMPSDLLTKESDEKDTLLIVEDNEEVRDYIAHIFKDEFHVLTASNGKEGLKYAKKYSPILIVSDVMMPVMDGIKMCEALKTDIEISHIPVILLTARTATMFKIEGLKMGADDYVTKPFNPEELKLRVQNLIQYRKQAQEKFSKVLTLDPKLIDITSADEEFLLKAKEILEKEIANPDFSVEQFASELIVSRALLFTKIKALTNQTPNNFMKAFRLKRAAQLLSEGAMNISEVAYKVGFNDPKYFSKCFQQQFGTSPSSFVENSEAPVSGN